MHLNCRNKLKLVTVAISLCILRISLNFSFEMVPDQKIMTALHFCCINLKISLQYRHTISYCILCILGTFVTWVNSSCVSPKGTVLNRFKSGISAFTFIPTTPQYVKEEGSKMNRSLLYSSDQSKG